MKLSKQRWESSHSKLKLQKTLTHFAPCLSKEAACNAGDLGSIPGLGRFPWRREWQPTPVFLPGEFHGQRSLAGYSLWGHKESDMAKQLTHTWMSPAGDITPPPMANRHISETSPHPHREERVEIITRNWQAGGGGVSSLNSSSLGHQAHCMKCHSIV